jgi:undecaprenyl-phosphate 4-deoxy-4-formamido-L-arabinose transferase
MVQSAAVTDSDGIRVAPASGIDQESPMPPVDRYAHIVSIVIPLYNESALAVSCYRRLRQSCEQIVENFQLVFVDDGSVDGTSDVLTDACQGDPNTEVIRLPRNVGQHQATLVGLRASTGDLIITMDADLVARPELIESLVACLQQDPECEVASAIRQARSASWFRSPASFLVTWITNAVCRTRLYDPGSTLKAMRRSVVERALQNEVLAQNLPMFVAYAGFAIREVEMPEICHEDRKSRYGFAGLIMTLALALLNYSSGARFLSVLLVFGGGLMASGMLLCLAVVVQGMVAQSALPTNVLLAGLLAVVLGGQVTALSVLGYKIESLMRNLRLRGMPAQFRSDQRYE